MPFIAFLHRLLQHINRVQLRPQDPSIDFRDAANDISGLKDVLHQEHNCYASSGIEQMVIEGKEFMFMFMCLCVLYLDLA